MKYVSIFLVLTLSLKLYAENKKAEAKNEKVKSEKIEILSHGKLKERLDIGPKFEDRKVYKVNSLYYEIDGTLCQPHFTRSGKALCDNVESLVKRIYFKWPNKEQERYFYRNKGSYGCYTFKSTGWNLEIFDFKVGACQ